MTDLVAAGCFGAGMVIGAIAVRPGLVHLLPLLWSWFRGHPPVVEYEPGSLGADWQALVDAGDRAANLMLRNPEAVRDDRYPDLQEGIRDAAAALRRGLFLSLPETASDRVVPS